MRGKPAPYSRNIDPEWMSFGPDNGTLAWESAPGEVSYIGFSGSATKAVAIEALRALADNGKVLSPAQWEAQDPVPVYP